MIEIRESFDWCFNFPVQRNAQQKSFYKFTSESSIFQSYEKKEKTPDTEGKQANKVENDIVKKDRRLRTLQICHMNMKF